MQPERKLEEERRTMSHEIGTQDGIVLHKEKAWHGLGLVVEEAPTPREALTLAGLDWGVIQLPIKVELSPGKEEEIGQYVANYRADSMKYLGLVGSKYQPIQNYEVADFCEALHETQQVKVETAGSIRNGGMVWFLLKGEPFNVVKDDQVFPYLLVSNGHDGGATFRVTPTFIRTVCRNTLSMVVPTGLDTGELNESVLSIRHTTNIMERLDEARKALVHYGQSKASTTELIQEMAKKDVNKEKLIEFFTERYQIDFGTIPTEPKGRVQENQKARAESAFASFMRRFDDETPVSGANHWTMFNAYSGLCQHDAKARGKNDEDRIAKRQESNLFGLNHDRTLAAFQSAFKMSIA